jgi:hypothetical protein
LVRPVILGIYEESNRIRRFPFGFEEGQENCRGWARYSLRSNLLSEDEMKEQIVEKIKKMIVDEERNIENLMKYYTKKNGTFTNHGSQIHSYRMIAVNQMKEILKFVEGLR